MFGPDPINFFDPSPYGALAYYGHYVFGSIALLAVLIAFAVRKGTGLHRTAGLSFIAACAILTLTNISMLSDRFIPPLMMAAVSAVYAIGGAYLALQSSTQRVKVGEYILTSIEVAGLALFLSIAVPEALSGRIPLVAPLIIASVPLILLVGDAYWFTHQKQRKQLRVARHLSRMVWGFAIVIRAPIVEIAAAGAPIPAPLAIFGPLALAVVMLWYFQRKYGGMPFGKRG